MSIISVKQSSKALTIIASVICIGGILSIYRVDEKSKPLALNLAVCAGAIAVGSGIGSSLCEIEANNQADKLVQKHDTQIKLVEKDRDELRNRLNKQISVLDEVKALNQKHEQTILQTSTELQLKNKLVVSLESQLAKLQKDVETKLQQDDNRYETTIYLLKSGFQESLKIKIDDSYERLADNISSNLNDERFEGIRTQLQHLYNSLAIRRNNHYSLLNEIAYLQDDISYRLTEIYVQITDEIASLRVRYRNTLNIDERSTLAMAMDELIERRDLKKFIPTPKVMDGLNQYKQAQKDELARIKNTASENSQELDELKDEVDTFIGQLEEKHNEIARLKQEIAELKKPQQFYGGSSIPQNANKVSLHYYKTYGYKLDAVNWAETPTGYQIIYGIRHNPALTEKEMYADNSREQVAAFANSLEGTLPTFDFNYQNCTLVLTVQMRNAPKKITTPQDLVNEVRAFLKPSESLIDFVRNAYHVGMWGETGRGKTTAISNTIGGMIQELGTPTIRTTVPKIDADSAKMFPTINWLGVPNSIFGLLEAALEIQYRIWINEQAFISGEEVLDFEPILFFIDEINLIFARWRKVNEADMEDVLERFSATLSGERLEYFTQFMQIELRNYKNEFAKRLLMFIWQTGRSLRVKSLIAGQNLQPAALGAFTTDLANCAYIAFGDSKTKCSEYKVKSSNLDTIKSQIDLVERAEKTDPQLQFTALYCPSVGTSFLSLLPAPNTYKWDKSILCPNSVQTASKHLSSLDAGQNNVQDRPSVYTLAGDSFSDFVQASKLSKQYQNLGYEGSVHLWASLPKKDDGSVHKTQAYEKVFKVSRSNERKIYSEFIDYLEGLCK
jgi:hypothetical protein